MEKLIYGVVITIVVILCTLYMWHIWSDCMDENSWLTCVRMLSR